MAQRRVQIAPLPTDIQRHLTHHRGSMGPMTLGKRHMPKTSDGFTAEPAVIHIHDAVTSVAIRLRQKGLRSGDGTLLVLAITDAVFAAPLFVAADALAWHARYHGPDMWPEGVNGRDGELFLTADERRAVIRQLLGDHPTSRARIGSDSRTDLIPDRTADLFDLAEEANPELRRIVIDAYAPNERD